MQKENYMSEGIQLRSLIRGVPNLKKSKEKHPYNKQTYNNQDSQNQQIQLSSISHIKYWKKQPKIGQRQFKFNLIEDPRQSDFSFRKYVLIEKMLLILTLFYLFICFIRTQVNQNITRDTAINQDRSLLLLMSIITVIISRFIFDIVLLVFLRSVCFNQLLIDQKKIYSLRHEIGSMADIIRFAKNRKGIINFFIEFLVIIVHPIIYTKDIKIELFQVYDCIMQKHDLNNIFCLVSLIRIYLVFRALINITQFSTPRAVRLCNYNRIDHHIIYSIKCLIQEHPLLAIIVVFCIQLLIFGYAMRITQGSVFKQNPQIKLNGFQNYINCFWLIFITMTTVGYGDYYPKTLTGRIVVVGAAINGIFLSSLLIVSLSAYLSMQVHQLSSHLALVRLDHYKKLQQQAAQTMIQTAKLCKILQNTSKKNQTDKLTQIFARLKHKIDRVKYKSRKIKSLVNNNNIMQQMNRLFQLLKQNLIALFNNQIQLKNNLQTMNKYKDNKTKIQNFLFNKHITHILQQ